MSDREAVPAVRPGDVLSAFPDAPSLSGEIGGRRLDFLLAEHRGNFIGAVALDGKLEDAPDNSGGFLVNQPVVLVIRVFSIAINGAVGSRLARLTLDPDGSSLLTAQVPQIPFAHDVDKRRKLAGTGVIAVDAVADGDETHPEFAKENLRIETGLQIVSADSAHVLRQHQSHFSGLNVGHQPFPCRPVEIPARPSVISVMDDIGKTMLGSVALQVLFLIHD